MTRTARDTPSRGGLFFWSRTVADEPSKAEGASALSSGMSFGLTLLFAVAAGAAVGNLYLAQPLLAEIAQTFGVPEGSGGLLVTMTQAGYAVGIFLIVPLGDTLQRHRLIPVMMILSALALIASAFAPSFTLLLAALAAVGLTTVAGQILAPLAGDLAKPEQRGRAVGTVISGVLVGILVSRTISGFLADAFGWRAIYLCAAVLIIVLAILLARALPALPPRPAVPYGRLLRSIFSTIRAHRAVQVTLVLGATVFSVFTMFWTGLTLLLSAPPFSYAASEIGLVGLVGLAGALAARRAGWLHDRGWSVPSTGGALVLALVSLAISAFGATSIAITLIAVFLIDIAIQALNVLNQTRLFAVDPTARSRLNTAYVSCNFIGGAIGSSLAGVLWHIGGWFALTFGGGVLIGFAFLVWATQRRALTLK